MNESERKLMRAGARVAIVSRVTGRPQPAAACAGPLAVRAGAFVSIHRRDELRGCIGHIERDRMLGEIIPRCAIAAATEDPRFPAVSAAELSSLAIELSILGPLEPLQAPHDVAVGRHGLVVQMGGRRGLLLPQVAIEWRWEREQFLAETCRKAGLRADAWKNGAEIWRFEAEVFGEVTQETQT